MKESAFKKPPNWSTIILQTATFDPSPPLKLDRHHCQWIATHLSKTSRLRVSLVLVGVLRVFWRSSTFFFRLCRQTSENNWQKWTLIYLPYWTAICVCVGDILQRSLYQHGTAPSAPTSCRLCFGSAPARLCATKMTYKKRKQLKFGGLTLAKRFICSSWGKKQLPCCLRWPLLASASHTRRWKTSVILSDYRTLFTINKKKE